MRLLIFAVRIVTEKANAFIIAFIETSETAGKLFFTVGIHFAVTSLWLATVLSDQRLFSSSFNCDAFLHVFVTGHVY
jgi:hypothetical protein